jgi:hypothetical protein
LAPGKKSDNFFSCAPKIIRKLFFLSNSEAGWPDWANFRPLANCLTRGVFF